MTVYSILQTSAVKATQLLGGKPENWHGVAAQLVQEKGWYWWLNPQPPFNIGNDFDIHGKLLTFASLDAGIAGYVHQLTVDPAGYYTRVIDAIRNGSAEDFLTTLSQSKYCYPAYPVAELMGVYGLVKLRFPIAPAPAPAPTPLPAVAPKWNVLVGTFDNESQAQEGAEKVTELTGYHATVQGPSAI